jgi:hypothetical protein
MTIWVLFALLGTWVAIEGTIKSFKDWRTYTAVEKKSTVALILFASAATIRLWYEILVNP